jgi:hypothetical protein
MKRIFKIIFCLTILSISQFAIAEIESEFTAHPEARFANMTPAEIDAYERHVAAKMKTLGQRELCDLALVPPILNTDPLPEYDYDHGLPKVESGHVGLLERTVLVRSSSSIEVNLTVKPSPSQCLSSTCTSRDFRRDPPWLATFGRTPQASFGCSSISHSR